MTTKSQDIPCLFEADDADETYMQIKTESELWHVPAKKYWQNRFEIYQKYLDKTFPNEICNDFHSQVWELTLVSYFDQLLGKNSRLIAHKIKDIYVYHEVVNHPNQAYVITEKGKEWLKREIKQ